MVAAGSAVRLLAVAPLRLCFVGGTAVDQFVCVSQWMTLMIARERSLSLMLILPSVLLFPVC
jgi:hypothetical protein